jgi:outer membrane protein TolC
LTSLEALCRAVDESSLANLLDKEAEQLGRGGCLPCTSQKNEVRKLILTQSAREYREDNGGNALEYFYNLLEAQLQADLLRQTQQVLQEAFQNEENRRKQGLPVPPQYEDLHKKHVDIGMEAAKLEYVMAQLNQELGRLIGVHGAPGCTRLQAIGSVELPPVHLEPHEEIHRAMEHRPYLAMLRELQDRLNAHTLPEIRAFLGTFSSLIGLEQKTSHKGPLTCLLALVAGKELKTRAEQLEQVRREQEEKVAGDVALALQEMISEQTRIQLAQTLVDRFEKTVGKYRKEQAEEVLTNALLLTEAQLQMLQARSQLIKSQAAWHRAFARLRRAQGLLAVQCEAARCHMPPPEGAPAATLPGAESTLPSPTPVSRP